MRWEYDYLWLERFNNSILEKGVEKLDEMGKEGWELVGQVGNFVLFKRCFNIETVYNEGHYNRTSSERIVYPYE